MFLYEVKQQQLLSGVRTFLKVYSTISLGKLAMYMEVDEPTLRLNFEDFAFDSVLYNTHNISNYYQCSCDLYLVGQF